VKKSKPSKQLKIQTSARGRDDHRLTQDAANHYEIKEDNMNAQNTKNMTISVPQALKLVGIIGGTWAILTILAAVLAYLPEHPSFSIFNTYMSDMGDTPGWPQIFFNSGTLMAVPIRYLILVLLALRLRQLGAGKSFVTAILIVGFLSTSGTALMTATPFSVSPIAHKSGIGLYFLGVVALQTMIFIKE
jgi:hypothetical protein